MFNIIFLNILFFFISSNVLPLSIESSFLRETSSKKTEEANYNPPISPHDEDYDNSSTRIKAILDSLLNDKSLDYLSSKIANDNRPTSSKPFQVIPTDSNSPSPTPTSPNSGITTPTFTFSPIPFKAISTDSNPPFPTPSTHSEEYLSKYLSNLPPSPLSKSSPVNTTSTHSTSKKNTPPNSPSSSQPSIRLPNQRPNPIQEPEHIAVIASSLKRKESEPNLESKCPRLLPGTKSQSIKKSALNSGEKIYSCPTCKKVFSSYADLKRHMDTNTNNDNISEAFVCKYCSKIFKRKHNLKAHLTKHHSDEITSSGENIEAIMSSAVKESLKFICYICKINYSSIKDLNKHIYTKHKKTFTCHLCSKKFKSDSTLNSHISFDHKKTLIPLLPKSTLESKFPRLLPGAESQSIKNPALNSDEKIYSCPIRKKVYKKNHLTQHIKTHTNRYPCSICKKNFSRPDSLKRHMNTHNNNMSEAFVCKYCSKIFQRKDTLKAHLNNLHSDEITSSGENIEAIMSSAVKESVTFICYICNIKYSSIKDFNKHIDTEHNISLNHNKTLRPLLPKVSSSLYTSQSSQSS
ncbi:hypothetical protein AB834_00580 [PVC group bacterium (ex Bugula neritina AB1)]|nr:hypothetical protein AB834_00580 [PVC group bacterium (ex Bugula neritina AB1)]